MLELRAETLGFWYPDGPPLLRNAELSLRIGETAVVVARNSSGKTTLLKLLAGMLRPCEGRISVHGTESDDLHGLTGLVFQNPDHQMIAQTVEQEIAIGLEFRNVPPNRIDDRVDELIKQFGLEALRKAAPESLSGGQKQRVALAAIFAMEPPFLLLDEPDSYLDAPSRRDFLRSVARLRDQCGVLWTVPDPRVMPDADRWLVLHEARLREVSLSEAWEFSRSA